MTNPNAITEHLLALPPIQALNYCKTCGGNGAVNQGQHDEEPCDDCGGGGYILGDACDFCLPNAAETLFVADVGSQLHQLGQTLLIRLCFNCGHSSLVVR